jgi:hypothetical protein
MQNACHRPHLIFPASAVKIELFTTLNTQSVSTLLIIFVRLLKNAHMQVELCEIPLAGAPKSLAGNAYMRFLLCRNDLPC